MSTTAEPPFDVTHNFRHIKGKRQIHSQEYRWAYNIILCDYIIYFCADMWCVSRMHCNIYRFWHKDPQSKAHSFSSTQETNTTLTTQPDTSLQLPRTTGNHLLYLSHSSSSDTSTAQCVWPWTLTFVLRRVVLLKKVLTQTFHLTLP